MLRTVRAFRVFRLFKRVPKIIVALGHALRASRTSSCCSSINAVLAQSTSRSSDDM